MEKQAEVFQGALFRFIYRSRINSFVLGLVLLILFQLIRTFLDWAFGDPFNRIGGPDIASAILPALFVFFVRGFRDDIKSLQDTNPSLNLNSQFLNTKYSHILICAVGFVLAYWVMRQTNTLLNPQFSFWQIVEFNLNRLAFNSGLELALQTWVGLVFHSLGGITFVYLWVAAFYSTKMMNQLAKTISLNLFNSHQLTQFANPFLRGLLLLVAILALTPNQTSSPEAMPITTNIALPLLALMTILSLIMLWPLLTLRNRIRRLKNQELTCVESVLQGNTEALSKSVAYEQLKHSTYVEQLNYRQHVLAVWEWPLHSHVQRILLYLIIPPITWALSAVVAKLIE